MNEAEKDAALLAVRSNVGLERCPFCEAQQVNFRWGGFNTYVQVQCGNSDCGAEGPPKRTENEAAVAWNAVRKNIFNECAQICYELQTPEGMRNASAYEVGAIDCGDAILKRSNVI